MDRTTLLCGKDRIMLTEFSKRSLERIAGRSLRVAPLPFIETYLDANVRKEVEKDRLIIGHAGKVFAAGKGAGDLDVDAVFEQTKEVDSLFVRNVMIPALFITVRYEDIEDTRKKRIRHLGGMAHGILSRWKDGASFEDTLRAAYSEKTFEKAIREILHLYNRETRQLSRSIRLLPPFNSAVDIVADTLFDIMEAVSKDMAAEYSNKIFGGKPAHVQA